jgi:trk system potassium uptake protein TrkA
MAGKDQTVAVIGLGKFGFAFGRTLVDLGHQVLGVDIDADRVRVAQYHLTQVYRADAMDKKALEQLGLIDMDHVIISSGQSIETSTMIALYLKDLGAGELWVKAVSTDHEKLLHKVGVDNVIFPERFAAKELAQRLSSPGFVEYLPFEKNVVIQELTVDNWDGKTLRELDLTNTHRIQVVAISKAGQQGYRFIPRADDNIRADDKLVVVGNSEAINSLEP